MSFLQYLAYSALAVAFIAMAVKALKYIRAPLHFRWELYPVPHEKGRAGYGGSYLEELDWWSKPRQTDLINEIKEMAEEIFLLKGVFRHNKRVWVFSFPFHFGLYLCIGWLVLLSIGSLINLSGSAVSSSGEIWGDIVYYLTIIAGYAGLILAGIGAAGLLRWRLTDENQRPYNSFAEYFNLVFFIVVVGVTLVAHLAGDQSFGASRAFVGSLITLTPAATGGFLFSLEIILLSLLIMYVPLGRMSHFVAKYFLYHAVRWNDKPNERGSQIEKSLMRLLQKRVTWQAKHIQSGRRWSDVVKETNDE
jgi:nitrate reductase gamma subunit